MRKPWFGHLIVGAALCVALAATQLPVAAQLAGGAKGGGKDGDKGGTKGKGKAGPPAEPTKRLTTVEINQPDFRGVLDVPYLTNMGTSTLVVEGGKATCEDFENGAGGYTPSCAPFNEKGHNAFKRRRETDSATDPEGFCLPPGVPRMMYTPYPARIIQEPDWITFVFEGGAHVWRRIPLVKNKAAMKHTKDPNPTYLGESIGWWEGDTLVIDTIGFNDRTWLDFAGHPHGEKLHVVERYTRLNMNQMEHVSIIEDPEFYTKPWTVKQTVNYTTTKELMEYICQENEADSRVLLETLRKKGIDPDTVP